MSYNTDYKSDVAELSASGEYAPPLIVKHRISWWTRLSKSFRSRFVWKRPTGAETEGRLCWNMSGIAGFSCKKVPCLGQTVFCQEICFEEKELMFLRNLYIHSQNQRKVRLEETVYSRSSQSLIYLVEPLAAVVAPPYCRSCRCFKMGECHNLGTPAVTAFNLLLKTMIEKPPQKRDRESISCTLFFITRKFCCWRKVKVCSEGRGCLAVRSAPEEKMLRSLGRW